jgi:hypothetical protein
VRATGVWANLSAVVPDRFDRATFHRFLAKRFFLGALRLFVNVGVAAVVVAFVIRRRGLAAKITVDALIIDVVRTGNVFGVFVCCVGHIFPLKSELERRKKALGRKWKSAQIQPGATKRMTKGDVKEMARVPTKKERTKTLRAFLVELAIYIVFVTVYFFLVLHFLGAWLQDLYLHHVNLYGLT